MPSGTHRVDGSPYTLVLSRLMARFSYMELSIALARPHDMELSLRFGSPDWIGTPRRDGSLSWNGAPRPRWLARFDWHSQE